LENERRKKGTEDTFTYRAIEFAANVTEET